LKPATKPNAPAVAAVELQPRAKDDATMDVSETQDLRQMAEGLIGLAKALSSDDPETMHTAGAAFAATYGSAATVQAPRAPAEAARATQSEAATEAEADAAVAAVLAAAEEAEAEVAAAAKADAAEAAAAEAAAAESAAEAKAAAAAEAAAADTATVAEVAAVAEEEEEVAEEAAPEVWGAAAVEAEAAAEEDTSASPSVPTPPPLLLLQVGAKAAPKVPASRTPASKAKAWPKAKAAGKAAPAKAEGAEALGLAEEPTDAAVGAEVVAVECEHEARLMVWLKNLDSGKGALLQYADVLKAEFDSDFQQIGAVRLGEPVMPGIVGTIDPFFWEVCKIKPMGHRLLFARAINALAP